MLELTYIFDPNLQKLKFIFKKFQKNDVWVVVLDEEKNAT
jgi:hypothetical protein